MPETILPGAVPITLFPLKLEIRHDIKAKTADIRWYPDGGQAKASTHAGSDEELQHYLSQGDGFPALPDRVLLYTTDAAGSVQSLAEGSAIQSELVRLAVPNHDGAFKESRWLWDFEAAKQCGMGVTVSGAAFEQLASAKWLLAVGYVADTSGAAASILRGHEARGRLRVLADGEPTNNTEDGKTSSSFAHAATPWTPIATNVATNAELLSAAFRGTTDLWGKVANSELTDHEIQRHVHTCLWDGCTKHLFESGTLPVAKYEELRALFIDDVRGRGYLPGLRIGKNPYGVLIAMASDRLGAEGLLAALADPQEAPGSLRSRLLGLALLHGRTIHRHAVDLAAVDAAFQATGGHGSLAQYVGERGDVTVDLSDNDLDRLLATLRQDAVSSRCDVLTVDGATVQHGQPAVDLGPGDYLALPDDKSGIDMQRLPLLTRLLVESERSADTDVRKAEFRQSVRLLFTTYRNHLDELATLMMEALDCLSHRIDAWVTAGAVRRWKSIAAAGQAGVGVFGWLEHPVSAGQPTANFEYHQAPSLAQAQTLAILRAGSLTAEDAFDIDLSGPRVCQALDLVVDMLAGVPLAETLGEKVRARFHSEKADGLLLKLRNLRPFNAATSDVSCPVDGETFVLCNFEEPEKCADDFKPLVAAVKALLTSSEYGKLLAIWREMRAQRDALADVCVAEAVYQYNLGNLARTKAWLDVLEGNPLPGMPEVVRASVPGRNLQQRALLLMGYRSQPAQPTLEGLRGAVEPSLSAFCAAVMSLPRKLACRVRWSRAGAADARDVHVEISILAGDGGSALDLAVSAMDVVLGGKQELERRVKLCVMRDLVARPEHYDGKPSPASEPANPIETIARELWVDIRDEAWNGVFETGARLAALVQSAGELRASDFALEYSDLVAQEDRPERDAVAAAREGIWQLRSLQPRAVTAIEALEEMFRETEAAAKAAGEAGADADLLYLRLADELVRLGFGDVFDLDGSGSEGGRARRLEQVPARIRERAAALAPFQASRFSVLLEKSIPVEIELDGEDTARFVVGPSGAQQATVSLGKDHATVTLGGAGSGATIDLEARLPDGIEPGVVAAAIHPAAVAAQAVLTELRKALAASCGTDRMFVLGPASHASLNPSWLTDEAVDPAWTMGLLRPGMELLGRLEQVLPIAHKSALCTDRTDAEVQAEIKRQLLAAKKPAEEVARAHITVTSDGPRGNTDLHLYGTASAFEAFSADEPITGLILDEWVDSIPAEAQDTAITFNYDVPQAEAPNAILIVVPSGSAWQPHEAARALSTVIDLLRLRTLSADEVLTDPRLAEMLPAPQLTSDARLGRSTERSLTGSLLETYRDRLVQDVVSTAVAFDRK
jgi:hypothetical protein